MDKDRGGRKNPVSMIRQGIRAQLAASRSAFENQRADMNRALGKIKLCAINECVIAKYAEDGIQYIGTTAANPCVTLYLMKGDYGLICHLDSDHGTEMQSTLNNVVSLWYRYTTTYLSNACAIISGGKTDTSSVAMRSSLQQKLRNEFSVSTVIEDDERPDSYVEIGTTRIKSLLHSFYQNPMCQTSADPLYRGRANPEIRIVDSDAKPNQ